MLRNIATLALLCLNQCFIISVSIEHLQNVNINVETIIYLFFPFTIWLKDKPALHVPKADISHHITYSKTSLMIRIKNKGTTKVSSFKPQRHFAAAFRRFFFPFFFF